jgi:high affinity Mn2+ porin
LAAHGISFFLGAGRLNFRLETLLETYCSQALSKGSWISLDWQHITSLPYNADRGPVNLAAIRLHTGI